MVPANSHRISPVPRYSGVCYVINMSFRVPGYHRLRLIFPDNSTKTINTIVRKSYNPTVAVTTMVWANPRSLATTCGITVVFFSSAYLDVSVRRVHFTTF